MSDHLMNAFIEIIKKKSRCMWTSFDVDEESSDDDELIDVNRVKEKSNL